MGNWKVKNGGRINVPELNRKFSSEDLNDEVIAKIERISPAALRMIEKDNGGGSSKKEK